MKKSTIVALSFLTAGLAFTQVSARAAEAATHEKPAHGEKSRRDQAGGQLKMLAEKLSLTDAQKAQAAEILKAEGAKLAALREDESQDRQAKMKQMREIREDGRVKIRAILTPEQQKIFDTLPKRGPGGGPGGGGGRPEHGGGEP